MIDYHLHELELIRNSRDPRRAVPNYPCKGWIILDVGCGIGQTLAAPEFVEAAELHGVDVDSEAVASRHLCEQEPRMHLMHASAHRLPYGDRMFDLVFSRVAVPYMNIPKALKEMHRVLKPGGNLWLTLHPWRFEMQRVEEAFRNRNLKILLDRGYVIANSVLFALTGYLAPRPWNGEYESVQTGRGITRVLRKTGFERVSIDFAHHFTVTATKGCLSLS